MAAVTAVHGVGEGAEGVAAGYQTAAAVHHRGRGKGRRRRRGVQARRRLRLGLEHLGQGLLGLVERVEAEVVLAQQERGGGRRQRWART